MWSKSFSKVYQGVTKEAIWLAWMDVNNWPSWDCELEYCKLDGALEQGKIFLLKAKGGPEVKIEVTQLISQEQFTDRCRFFGASMIDDHQLEETEEGIRITNTISVKGILSFLWVKLVASNVAKSVPAQTDALVDYVKQGGRL